MFVVKGISGYMEFMEMRRCALMELGVLMYAGHDVGILVEYVSGLEWSEYGDVCVDKDLIGYGAMD